MDARTPGSSPAYTEADVLRFRAQLRLIEARVFTMPRIDAVLLPDGTQGRESRRFTHSLREAERLELRATTA